MYHTVSPATKHVVSDGYNYRNSIFGHFYFFIPLESSSLFATNGISFVRFWLIMFLFVKKYK